MTIIDACALIGVEESTPLLEIYKNYAEKHSDLRKKITLSDSELEKEELETKALELTKAFDLISNSFNLL